MLSLKIVFLILLVLPFGAFLLFIIDRLISEVPKAESRRRNSEKTQATREERDKKSKGLNKRQGRKMRKQRKKYE